MEFIVVFITDLGFWGRALVVVRVMSGGHVGGTGGVARRVTETEMGEEGGGDRDCMAGMEIAGIPRKVKKVSCGLSNLLQGEEMNEELALMNEEKKRRREEIHESIKALMDEEPSQEPPPAPYVEDTSVHNAPCTCNPQTITEWSANVRAFSETHKDLLLRAQPSIGALIYQRQTIRHHELIRERGVEGEAEEEEDRLADVMDAYVNTTSREEDRHLRILSGSLFSILDPKYEYRKAPLEDLKNPFAHLVAAALDTGKATLALDLLGYDNEMPEWLRAHNRARAWEILGYGHAAMVFYRQAFKLRFEGER